MIRYGYRIRHLPDNYHSHVSVDINLSWLFFFSSRRRHTRCSRDWSSDVCSSDLVAFARPAEGLAAHLAATYPHKRLVERKGVGILVIVDEKLVAEFVARVTEPLDGLALKQRLAVAEAAKLDLIRSEEHTSELQSRLHLVCRLLLEKKKNKR